jgi:uncharacterized phage protein gp47/JayE
MQLSLQNFTSLMQNMAAAAQSAASQLLDLTVGSTTRAVLEANASIALWMQWLIVQVLQMTRAATSTGTDLDSWMADMTLVRLPAVAATGEVTFARYTPLGPASIPVGALVRTADGSIVFSVVADASNSAWNAATSSYILPAGLVTVTIPVSAQQPGSAGNVQAGTITMLATAIPGVDTVVNNAAFTNGLDAETDAAFRLRFQNFLNTRSRATTAAVGNAITSLQQGLMYLIQENVDASSNSREGNFVVTVDDGSGSPPASLLSSVFQAVDAVRPLGSTFSVQPPVLTVANISMTLTTSGPSQAAIAAVTTAIGAFVNTLTVGTSLPITRLAQIAYDASPAITNVNSLLINGSATDLVSAASGVIRVGTVSVS